MTVDGVADAAPPDVIVGLSSAAAAERLARDGPNELPRPPGRSAPRQLLGQFTHFFAILLWVASGLAVLAGMPQLAIAIVIVVVINGTFAFVQEHRAEQAAAGCGTCSRSGRPSDATAARVVIDAAELVTGDVVMLAAGDRISADLTLLTTFGLAIDTSTMTGESVPERPAPGDRALAGTFVTGG